MRTPNGIYDDSLAFATDLYQLTMAYGYWKTGVAERRATFNLFCRKAPFQSGYTIACGLQNAIDYLNDLLNLPSDSLLGVSTLDDVTFTALQAVTKVPKKIVAGSVKSSSVGAG